MCLNDKLQQQAQDIADEHCNDAYSVALAMLERGQKVKSEAVLEAFEEARIPEGAKCRTIGEFSVHVEGGGVCPNCYAGYNCEDVDEDCEICGGESVGGLYDVDYDIPWITQKEIFKAFCKCAVQDYVKKLENEND